jgi:excinuclease ABC subunit C
MTQETLIQALKTMPHAPGVYRMVDASGQDLYIGKAKNLAKRISHYTQVARLPQRLQRMVKKVSEVKIVVTETELEALLLEASLIQQAQPPYNILLKGQPFSYLILTDHAFPRLMQHRFPPSNAHRLGIFLSQAPLRALMECLQRAFLLRTCSDFVFSHRSRPCLQFHLGRCSAPCVKQEARESYPEVVEQALRFAHGSTTKLHQELTQQMKKLSQDQLYLQARVIRDRLLALPHHTMRVFHGDAIAWVYQNGTHCIQWMGFRQGHTIGAEVFFFPNTSPKEITELLYGFFCHFYEKIQPPSILLLNHPFQDEEDIKTLLRHRFASKTHPFSLHFIVPKRGEKAKKIRLAEDNAKEALKRHFASSHEHIASWQAACTYLGFSPMPQRIEIIDNSHHQGDSAVSVIVVVSQEGFLKQAYRTFSMSPQELDSHDSRDDYAMMRRVIQRRFGKKKSDLYPDVLVIDGGKGQFSSVQSALKERGISLDVVAIAKGERGADHLYHLDASHTLKALELPHHHPVLHFFQRLRDEAHRFAIHTHRQKKRRRMVASKPKKQPT